MELNQRIDAFIEENKDAIIKDIGTLVAIPSVQGAPAEGAPFGKEVARALDTTLRMATDMGFDAHNVDGYFGYADLKGKSDTQIATIGHLDVVPEGNGWTQNPYEMQVRDGYLMGRGTGDDKGPTVLTMYMAKFFKEQGEMLPYTIRLMFGTNEESGMAGLTYYQTKFEDPAFCFSPDSSFPVCCGEKGIFSGDFTSAKMAQGKIVELSGGIASNVVPDRATALVKADFATLPQANDIELTQEGDCVRILAKGIGGHAAGAENTINAIGVLVDYLMAQDLCTADEREFFALLQDLFCGIDGAKLGIASDDGNFTPLSCVGGMIAYEDGVYTQNINVRFPTSITDGDIVRILNERAATVGASFAACGHTAQPFYIDPQSPDLQVLMQAYRDVSGNMEEPFTMGGGTYARHFKRGVAFGPGDHTCARADFVGDAHMADEGVSIDVLMRGLKVYILAMSRLMELPF